MSSVTPDGGALLAATPMEAALMEPKPQALRACSWDALSARHASLQSEVGAT